MKCTIVSLIVMAAFASSSMAREDVRAVTYSPHAAHADCHMNMGPIGAKAWVPGYRFVVMSVDQGAPADGQLLPGDEVLAINGVALEAGVDPRITLGNAIGLAEETGVPLKFTIRRDGRKHKAAVDLPLAGGLAPTWPAACDKSAAILDAACQSLLDVQLPSGGVITDGSMGTFLTGLLLLGSGDAAYLDGARRAAYEAASLDYEKIDHNNWPMGYGGLLLAEYYLATGDDSVLETLTQIADAVGKGQMLCGSWGHKSPGAGYGALNQPGIVCAIMLVLAQECGVAVDQEALAKALTFFGRYAELGSVPYGDHGPGRWPDDNGHNASSAVLMHLAGQSIEKTAFSRSVAMSYWMREEGHTGGFFSLVWGPLGAALAGQDAFRQFMDYQRWYYNLCRTWKGELVLLPYHEALTRFDSSSYNYFGGDFTTGGMALVYALPRKHLRILGAAPSVFSPQVKLSGDLLVARRHYLARDWDACDQTLQTIFRAGLKSPDEVRWHRQLTSARALTRASAERILQEIESNLVEGDFYRASEQFQALKRCVGEKSDSRFETLEERLAEGTAAWYTREGKQYYEAWAGLRAFAVKSWVPQGKKAKRLIEGLPTLRPRIWEPLSATSQLVPQSWRTLLLDADQPLPEDWEAVAFNDREWRRGEGIFVATDADEGETYPQGALAARRRFYVGDPRGSVLRVRLQTVRPAETRVYLNGVCVVNAVRGQRGGYAPIELDKAALSLLQTGENVLAVCSTAQGKGGNHLDVGLDIGRVAGETRTLPVVRPDVFVVEDAPDGDFQQRLRDTKNAMQTELQESYNQKSIDALLDDLADPVAYSRHLAENALVGKGLEGLKAALALVEHPEWKVRSAICNVIAKAWGASGDEGHRAAEELKHVQVLILTRLLDDRHFWVRVRAATALARFGDGAQGAVPTLLERVQDPNEWVRTAAIKTLRAVNKDPETALKAALASLTHSTTAYGAPRTAFALLKDVPAEEDGRLGALLRLLQHPPEGGGGRLLCEVIEMCAGLDPAGTRVIPVLTEIASDVTHYSRQRGNPRGKAIETLGTYGEKAASAIPVLEAILTSEAKAAQGQHEAARTARDAIVGP